MSIIGIEYKIHTRNGRIVKNVPYNKHDYPCCEGCCDNELSIGIGTAHRVSWLLNVYMPDNNISEFDYNDWSEELEALWKEYLYRDKSQ